MAIAKEVAERSTCRRLQVGAVLARGGRILSTGYCGAPSGEPHCDSLTCGPAQPCDRTIHAEANAIAWAARTGVQTFDSTLYCTDSPCLPCAKLLINAGVTRVVYLRKYRDQEPIELLKRVDVGVLWWGGP